MWTEFAENDMYSWDFDERRHKTGRGGRQRENINDLPKPVAAP
jgi:hypothetical protein